MAGLHTALRLMGECERAGGDYLQGTRALNGAVLERMQDWKSGWVEAMQVLCLMFSVSFSLLG